MVSKSIEDGFIQIQSRSMPDPPLSDIDFKNKMAWLWTTLKNHFKNLKFFIITWLQNVWIDSSGLVFSIFSR